MNNPTEEEDPTKLNNQLIELLEGLNNRKSRIDEQVKFLTNLPKISPFEPLPPEQSLVSRETWETWWSEHDQIENEAGIFREDEFALMKRVAMSKTTNMSREDTDVVGLTLCTLGAFSKLEHLLRSRRKQIQILDLRIKWDHQTRKVWQDLEELESQLPKILSKIRWNPPSQDMDYHIQSTIPSPHFNSSLLTTPPSITSNSPLSPSSTKRVSLLSKSLPSQKSVSDHFSNSDPSKPKSRKSDPNGLSHSDPSTFKPRKSDPNGLNTNQSPFKSDINPSSSFISNSQSQFIQCSPKSNCSTRFPRMNSLPAFNTNSPSAITVSSSYSSPQSKAMRVQSLTLQLTSIISKLHTLSRSVTLTSTTIDQLIDSGLHIPVAFLDLQDKLEATVKSFQPIQTAQFCNTLMDQYREADNVWFNLFNLGLEVESNKREIAAFLADAQVDQIRSTHFEEQFDRLSTIYEAYHLQTQLRALPTHSNYPEQPKFNKLLINYLQSSSEQIRRRLNEFNDSIARYRFTAEALRETERLGSSMEKCKQNLTASIQQIENLNERHPQRPWLMNNLSCLTPHDEEKEYETEWNKIMSELEKNLSTGLDLLKTTQNGLPSLNVPELNPDVKSRFQETRQGLKKLIEQVQQSLTSKEQSFTKLSRIRTSWEQILEVQTEMRRLSDQLLSDAHREKWRARKVSSSTPSLPTEELDSVASPHPSRWHSYREVEKYLSETIQPLFNTTLAELENAKPCPVHQHFLNTFHDILNVQAPQIARLEKMVQQICLQTSQVRKVESEYDIKVLEGGRWMKKVQGFIGVELEHTYVESEQSINPMEREARQVEKSRSTEALAPLTNYLRGIDSFCNSLSGRIPFIAIKAADDIVMQDGPMMLDSEAHDRFVRAHLNVLTMNLMSLKDQISNESALLQWINSSNVDQFEQAVSNVRNDIKMTDTKLEKLEANIQRVQSLIESDVDEPFLTDDQLEQEIDQPLRELQTSLEQIENRLSESTSVHLGAFIASCPSSTSSQAFKPDQFILPKQMSHHQLQSLYNQTCRRLKDIHTLSLKFKNETNLRRKNEIAWREDWSRNIDELTQKCEKLQIEISINDSEIATLENESVDWENNRFKALEPIELNLLNNRTPNFLNELTLYESRSSQSLASLDAFHSKIDLFHKQTVAVKADIEEKLPVFIHLVTDLTTLSDQLRCRWEKSRDAGIHVSDSINDLKKCVENFTKELEKRLGWKSQCDQLMDVQLEAVKESLIPFDEILDQLSNSWCTFDEGKQLDKTTFFSLLHCLRSLNEHKTVFVSIKSNIEDVQNKLLTMDEEIIALSTKDVPHGYLIEAKTGLNNLLQGITRRSENLERVENNLLALISRVHSLHELWLTEELENEVCSKHYDIENARLKEWNQENLVRFIDSVQTESLQIDKFHRQDELSPPQTPIISQLQRSTTSMTCMTDIDTDVKDQIVKAEGLVKSTSDMAQRLQILNISRTELASQIDFFRQTLPSQCNNYLETILRDPNSEFNINELNRFEAASSKLQEIESDIAGLVRLWEERLARAKENSTLIQDQIDVMNTCSHLSALLKEVNIDEWIDHQVNSEHSPLPNHTQLEPVLEILQVASSEMEKLSNAGISMDQSSLKDVLELLEDLKQKTEVLRQLVDFQSATSKCNQSFSALLDTLDVQHTETEQIKASELVQSAFAALETLIKLSKEIDTDPRVGYHVNRSKQTWEELQSMVKDRVDEQKEDPKSQNWNGKPHSAATLPSSVRPNHDLANVIDSPPPMNFRQGIPIKSRVKHSSDRMPEQTERSDIPIGLTESPSYTASHRHGKRTPDPFSSRAKTRTLRSETLNSKLTPQRPLSRENKRNNKFDSLSSTSSKPPKDRPRLNSVLGNTPSRPSVNKSLATAPNSSSSGTLYKPQSNRNIDKLVGKVVNSLARNKLKVHVAPAEGWEDNSGMYWIGEKVYFCRILRSQTVMVRIGGGWCELSAFIIEHLRLNNSSNTSPLELRTAGGSERLTQVDHSLIKHSSSSELSVPASSVVTSCHSSPSTTYPGALTDSPTPPTPASSITAVLITTPQEIRIANRPHHSPSSFHNKILNQQNTPTIQNGTSLTSTPTEPVQMIFRKVDNRNYLSKNFSPHQHYEKINNSLVHHHKGNHPRASSSNNSSSPKIESSCLSPPASNNNNHNNDDICNSNNNNSSSSN